MAGFARQLTSPVALWTLQVPMKPYVRTSTRGRARALATLESATQSRGDKSLPMSRTVPLAPVAAGVREGGYGTEVDCLMNSVREVSGVEAPLTALLMNSDSPQEGFTKPPLTSGLS